MGRCFGRFSLPFARARASSFEAQLSSLPLHVVPRTVPTRRHQLTEIALPDGCRVPYGRLTAPRRAQQVIRGRTAVTLDECDAALAARGVQTRGNLVCGAPTHYLESAAFGAVCEGGAEATAEAAAHKANQPAEASAQTEAEAPVTAAQTKAPAAAATRKLWWNLFRICYISAVAVARTVEKPKSVRRGERA